jgi:hypothetical protein
MNSPFSGKKGELETMRFHRVVVLMIVLFLSVGSLQSQSTISGYVTGIVTDPSKAAVTNAKVAIENTATSFRQSGLTNLDGVFRFEYVPPGNYALTVSADGFNTWREFIVVTVGQSTTANAALKVGPRRRRLRCLPRRRLFRLRMGTSHRATTRGRSNLYPTLDRT